MIKYFENWKGIKSLNSLQMKFLLSHKAGPNGKAIQTAIADYKAIQRDLPIFGRIRALLLYEGRRLTQY
jgi:hypothetical protein